MKRSSDLWPSNGVTIGGDESGNQGRDPAGGGDARVSKGIIAVASSRPQIPVRLTAKGAVAVTV